MLVQATHAVCGTILMVAGAFIGYLGAGGWESLPLMVTGVILVLVSFGREGV